MAITWKNVNLNSSYGALVSMDKAAGRISSGFKSVGASVDDYGQAKTDANTDKYLDALSLLDSEAAVVTAQQDGRLDQLRESFNGYFDSDALRSAGTDRISDIRAQDTADYNQQVTAAKRDALPIQQQIALKRTEGDHAGANQVTRDNWDTLAAAQVVMETVEGNRTAETASVTQKRTEQENLREDQTRARTGLFNQSLFDATDQINNNISQSNAHFASVLDQYGVTADKQGSYKMPDNMTPEERDALKDDLNEVNLVRGTEQRMVDYRESILSKIKSDPHRYGNVTPEEVDAAVAKFGQDLTGRTQISEPAQQELNQRIASAQETYNIFDNLYFDENGKKIGTKDTLEKVNQWFDLQKTDSSSAGGIPGLIGADKYDTFQDYLESWSGDNLEEIMGLVMEGASGNFNIRSGTSDKPLKVQIPIPVMINALRSLEDNGAFNPDLRGQLVRALNKSGALEDIVDAYEYEATREKIIKEAQQGTPDRSHLDGILQAIAPQYTKAQKQEAEMIQSLLNLAAPKQPEPPNKLKVFPRSSG